MRSASRLAKAAKRGRRGARLAVCVPPLAVLVLGAGLVATTVPAYANIGSDTYTIGIAANAVGSVYASPNVVVQSAPTDYELDFMVTQSLSGAAGGTITVTSSAPLTPAPDDIALLDDTDSACFQSGTDGGVVATTSFSVRLTSSCQLSAGDLVEVDFNAGSPASTGNFDFDVTTSANAVPASSNTVVVSASPPVLTASSAAVGANATYTLTDASWTAPALTRSPDALVLTAKALSGGTLSWYSGAAGYSVSATPLNGTATPDDVSTATLSTTTNLNDTVTLVLDNPVAAGDVVTVVAKGTSPSVASNDEVSVTPAVGPQASLTLVGPAETSSNAVLVGTAVSGVSVSASPSVAGAAATYAVSFQASTGLPGGSGSDICLNEPGGPTLFSSEIGVLVSDTTAGWHLVASGVTFPSGTPATDPGCDATDNGAIIPVGPGYAIRTGDYITLTVAGVTNPAAGMIGDFSVSTSSDTVPADAPPYVIGANGSEGVVVSVSPTTTGSLATYTISNLVASAALAGGTSAITLDGPAGTVFPNGASYYAVEDSSAPSGSGTVTSPVSGGGTNDVSVTVPHAINAGDDLSLTIEDVINPSSASAGYSITLLGDVTGPAPVAPFPQANVSYPSSAVVNFGGTDYVFAGGRPFGIASPAGLSALARVDNAEVQVAPAGTAVPSSQPRAGTLVFTRPVNGSPTIYVVGTDGELHGFATPVQFLDDGYDAALVVTVTTLNGLTIGATAGSEGSALDALSTSADGAIVASAGAYYVFAGGRAFGLPSVASLDKVRETDEAKVLVGTVTQAQQEATMANGVLLSTSGLVYVSYRGDLWPFKSQDQLLSDGYGGTAAVPVPGTSGVGVVTTYSGS